MKDEALFQFVITGPRLSEPVVLSLELEGVATIGRNKDNDIVANHALVSRYHARFEISAEGAIQIIDLNSVNGTIVNGEAVPPGRLVVLSIGDIVDIGPYRIVLSQLVDGEVNPLAVEAIESTVSAPESEHSAETAPLPIPPGLSINHSYYSSYLPDIFQSDLMVRFLAMLESIALPIQWNVYNFDLFLDPRCAPEEFLPWLAIWFDVVFDDTWSEAQKRQLLVEANDIFAGRGTQATLERVLEIYTGEKPTIEDEDGTLAPYTFSVHVPLAEHLLNRQLVEKLINVNKPVHTNYQLTFGARV